MNWFPSLLLLCFGLLPGLIWISAVRRRGALHRLVASSRPPDGLTRQLLLVCPPLSLSLILFGLAMLPTLPKGLIPPLAMGSAATGLATPLAFAWASIGALPIPRSLIRAVLRPPGLGRAGIEIASTRVLVLGRRLVPEFCIAIAFAGCGWLALTQGWFALGIAGLVFGALGLALTATRTIHPCQLAADDIGVVDRTTTFTRRAAWTEVTEIVDTPTGIRIRLNSPETLRSTYPPGLGFLAGSKSYFEINKLVFWQDPAAIVEVLEQTRRSAA